MNKKLVIIGTVILVIGVVLAVILYPMIGYKNTSEASTELSDKLGGISLSGLTGVKVNVEGTVDKTGSEFLSQYNLDWLLDEAGIDAITLKDLKVTTEGLLGYGGGTYEVIIIGDNPNVAKGDSVTVDGYAFGMSGAIVIIGDSGTGALSKLLAGTLPAPAHIEKIPHSSFYVALGILVFGIVLIAVGAILKKKEEFSSQQPQYPPEQPREPPEF